MTFLQNSTINRKSFRHRKVDNKKPLRIYTPGEINEDDCIPVSRAGIEIETGVEKEEEEEWHLVNALKLRTESMEKGATASGKATIPVPTSSRRISYYADVYQAHKWKKPSTYVKFSLPVEECIGCLYCMDEKDDIWLAEHKQKTNSTLTEDQFEEIMQHFENIAKNKPQLLAKKQIPSWQDCEACLPEPLQGLKGEAETVYKYWTAKRWERMKQYQKVGPLMFEIKTQEGKDEEDHPWTCFRRRELKPIRRTRRTETASFDKLRKIRKDIHSGRQIMVHVTMREKTKKQKIELDRKIFEKECTARELRKKLGIRNEINHEQPKRRKSSFGMDLGITKTKSGIKLFKKDDEYPMTDITDFPYLTQRKPTAASYFRKFDSLKPTDRNSISCTAFRSRFGRGGRRRRIIDRLDVFNYRRIRETNERYKYDSDGIEDVFSDDEINQLDCGKDEGEKYTENMIRFHLYKEEDYQNLGVYRRIQKEKQNSPTKQQSLDALTGNNIPAQNPQHTPSANSESRQIESRYASRSNIESRTALQLDTRANQDSRQKLEDPRTTADSRISLRSNGDTRTNANSIDPRTFIDSRSFNRNQSANTESSTIRVNSNTPSTPRLSACPRPVNSNDPRAHNGLISRPSVAMNHRDNPYRRMQKNNRIPDDSNNNTIGGVVSTVSTLNGMTPASIAGGSSNTSITAASLLAKNHANVQVTQINSPARPSSNSNNTNGQGNGDGLTRTPSNPGMIANNASQMVDPTKVFSNPRHAKILMNSSGQRIDPSLMSQLEKLNMVKQGRINRMPQVSTNAAMITPEQFNQLSETDLKKLISMKTSSTGNVTQQISSQNNQRQSTAQPSRQQNITVGSNVPSAVPQNIVLSSGMVQSPSTSVMRQNIVQSNGSSVSVPQNFPLANGFMSPTSGSSNVRQIQALRNLNPTIGVNGSQNINLNTNISLGNNGLQTINVNPNVTIGTNGSQQTFVHPNGIVMPIPTNGQPRTGRYLNNVIQINGGNIIGPSVLSSGNGLAAIQMNRHLVANGAATSANLRQVSNSAAIQNIQNIRYPNGYTITNNNGNFGHVNLNHQMVRPVRNMASSLLYPNQGQRQSNVSPASASTSNGGNSVGTPSPQPQAEQRTRAL